MTRRMAAAAMMFLALMGFGGPTLGLGLQAPGTTLTLRYRGETFTVDAIDAGQSMLVPARTFERLGCEVEWLGAGRTSLAIKSRMAEVSTGSTAMSVTKRGLPYLQICSAAPRYRSGRTFVPLRSIAEALGFVVELEGGVVDLQLVRPPAAAAGPGTGSAAETVTTASGLQYTILAEGTGGKPRRGQTVETHYTGWLTDGTLFDSSRERDEPFSFTVGQGEVIAGFDEALLDMRVGERRRIILPPELGYGEAGIPSGPIPPNATLVFEVELLAIR